MCLLAKYVFVTQLNHLSQQVNNFPHTLVEYTKICNDDVLRDNAFIEKSSLITETDQPKWLSKPFCFYHLLFDQDVQAPFFVV